LVSSVVLFRVHVYSALGTLALGAVGTVAIHVGGRTVRTRPASAAAH
jgi:hypothetical protein